MLRADHLHFFQSGTELLSDVSLTLSAGRRVGLVGKNGAGKTTLLRLLLGELQPADGRVVRSPGLRVSALGQAGLALRGSVLETAQRGLEHVRELERALRAEERRLANGQSLERYAALTDAFEAAGGYGAEGELERTLFALGFTSEGLTRDAATLSGGERARLGLASVLAQTPDVLLLDEPTNHLDLDMRRYLATRLTAFAGGLLVVSHDRALLDAVCTHTAHLKAGKLRLSRGNYAAFRAQQLHVEQRRQKRAKQAAKEAARSAVAQARLRAWGTPKAQRQRKRMARQTPAAASVHTLGTPKLSLRPREAKGLLFAARHLSKAFRGRTVIDDAAVRIHRGDKIALIGANGAGKTTLLKLIAGETASDHPGLETYWHRDAKLAVFDQESRGVAPDIAPLDQLTAYVSNARAELLLALVGVPKRVWRGLPTTLSGGERARLGVALLIASEANLLLLDEPSNDLDLSVIETLASTLRDTDAAVVFSSHDARLVEELGARLWSLESGELTEYRGGLAGYERGTKRLENDLNLEFEAHTPAPDPVTLEALEDERTDLETQFLDPLRLSERERERLERRYAELLNALSERYDAALPPPLPRYRAVVSGVEVTTDGLRDGRAHFTTAAPFRYDLLVQGNERIGHILLKEEGNCSLLWARLAALSALSRLAFERLELRTLQIQSDDELRGAGFASAGEGWWILSLSRYEKMLGLTS